MNFFELSHTLNIDETGLITATGANAKLERIKEWLSTPIGCVYGNPAWGNEFNKYKHNPASIQTAISIESSALKIVNDIEGINGLSVYCEPIGKDQYHIYINTPSGSVNEIVEL